MNLLGKIGTWIAGTTVGGVVIKELVPPASRFLNDATVGTTVQDASEMVKHYGTWGAPIMDYLPELAVAATVATTLMAIGYKIAKS